MSFLKSVLVCQTCRATDWRSLSRPGAGLCCRTCGAAYPRRDGVLYVDGELLPEADLERTSIKSTETDPGLGGWSEVLHGPNGIDPALIDAYLSLPYGDGSFRFEQPGYFANVQHFAPEFDFVVKELKKRKTSGSLLDLGADATWSTARLASSGFDCVALDISDHLLLGTYYQRACPEYALVNADMHANVFGDESFDVITAFNVLHHSSRIAALASNIARMLQPDGLVGLVEPYIQNASQETVFGQSQSSAGINEHVYAIEQWSAVFADAGLTLLVYAIGDSFNALFVKRAPDSPLLGNRVVVGEGDNYYRSVVSVQPSSTTLQPGQSLRCAVTVANQGCAGWASRGPQPIRLSYHVVHHAPDGTRTDRFDNPRTAIPLFISPGDEWMCSVAVDVAEAGVYELEFDLVHEARTWFKDRGGRTASATIRVPS